MYISPSVLKHTTVLLLICLLPISNEGNVTSSPVGSYHTKSHHIIIHHLSYLTFFNLLQHYLQRGIHSSIHYSSIHFYLHTRQSQTGTLCVTFSISMLASHPSPLLQLSLVVLFFCQTHFLTFQGVTTCAAFQPKHRNYACTSDRRSQSPTSVHSINIHIRRTCLNVRGGYIQQNPNYDDPNQFMPPKFGDMENDHIRRVYPSSASASEYHQNSTGKNRNASAAHPKPVTEAIREFFTNLFISSPALFYGITSSIFIFILWQIPSNFVSATLRRHFICSQYNLAQKRYHTLITSSMSHTTLSHIFMNIYGFLIFGKTVEPILKRNHISLSTFCILAAIFANLFFVKLHPQGSCIGLSGVSLALLALDAKLHPAKEIGFLVRFIPIRLPAHYALVGLFVWSLLGMMAMQSGRGDGVAHATHFGGLVFGVGVYELMKRGVWESWRKKWIRFRLTMFPRRIRNKKRI